MEADVLREGIEWEARRVAAAFGVEHWAEDVWFMHSTASLFAGRRGELEIVWRISPEAQVIHVRVGNGTVEDCLVTQRAAKWSVQPSRSHPQFNELMARGLFGLGFDDEDVLARLNTPLSMHEQLELRLAMPREFWPQRWLEQVGEASQKIDIFPD